MDPEKPKYETIPEAPREYPGMDPEGQFEWRERVPKIEIPPKSRDEEESDYVTNLRLQIKKNKSELLTLMLQTPDGEKPSPEKQVELDTLIMSQAALERKLDEHIKMVQARKNLHMAQPEVIGQKLPNSESYFLNLSSERIIIVRDIVEEIPGLQKLYNSYRAMEKKAGRNPLRRNLLAQVEATLRKGDKEDIKRAELMLYDGDNVKIDPKSVSELKVIINSIPNLKKLHDEMYQGLTARKKKTGLARLFSGRVTITNVEIVTSIVEHLREQSDHKSKALLQILSYYSQKQKPR